MINNNELPTLQWFPGHMKKAQRLIEENLKLVDIVIEVLDARIPFSSQNPMLKDILNGKLRLFALAKSDLADKQSTTNWTKKFNDDGITAIAVDAVKGTGIKNLIAAAKSLAESKTHKLTKHGAKPRSARAMIIGIPNVGKSSLINKLAGLNHTKIENRPGVTRAKQWIKIDNGLDLLDTPGILYPKFEDQMIALKLAWTYAISDEIHDLEPIVCLLLENLMENYPSGLIERFKLTEPLPTNGHELLEVIGKKRGCIRKGGIIDTEKAQRIVLSEFREGKLGRVTLDKINVE
ncbi:MAG: ribosome biogenesis GTPase YlqF [Selenomonadaceae bacterium]|nr:ribosome biogenesis GTPase YlqF [Selenomonadaceae bacterium]